MRPYELARQCADSVRFATENGFPVHEASICITTPKGWKPPPRWPRGRIVRWLEDGSRVRYVPAMNLLAWMAANKLIEVQLPPQLSSNRKDGGGM